MEATPDKKHPRTKANFFSIIFFIFTLDTFKIGHRNGWKTTNIYDTIDFAESNALGEAIEEEWSQAKKRSRNDNTHPNLLRILLKMFWRDLALASILLSVAQIALRIAEPLLLTKLLNYFKEEGAIGKDQAICLGLLICGAIGARTILYSQYKMCTYHIILKSRVACNALIYRKVLHLSLDSLQRTTTGKIMHLISNDVNRFDNGMDLINFIWVAPISVLLITYIMYIETGISGMVGVLWFCLVAVLQSYNGNLTASILGRLNSKSDNRLRLMNEIIAGIQVIKMYAWEKPFMKLIQRARREELVSVVHLNYVRNIFLSFSSICNHSALFLTLCVMVSMKEPITSAKVYGLVVYYGVLNYIVSIMFILGISKSVEIYKIIQRVNGFLNKDEFLPVSIADASNNAVVHLDDVGARWNSNNSLSFHKLKGPSNLNGLEEKPLIKSPSKTVLENINLDLKRELVGIIGPVGSGKSSLLQTILGELQLTKGKINVQNSVSYASQDAWTFCGTVKENILFGEVFKEDRYKEVVKVCCLEKDFALFPNGDSTVIGDRGASLSGGQKSRINLARAVYRERKLYLLDDPLASVDVQVAKHIYHNCIEEFLKGTCRVLVTHHVHHLKTADKIIVLNGGSITDMGNYQELTSRKRNREVMNILETSNENLGAVSTIEEEPLIDNDDAVIKNDEQQSSTNSHEYTTHSYPLKQYFLRDINYFYFVIIFLLFTLNQTLISSSDFFLSTWINNEEHKNQTINTGFMKVIHLYFPTVETTLHLYIYGGLIFLTILCNLVRTLTFVNFFKTNSMKLHDRMFEKVLNATMAFYDKTSSGQMLNRFSREMQSIDEYLPRTISEALLFINSLIAAILIVVLLNPYVVVMVAVMSVSLVSISYFYMGASRNIKEVESSLMSPILSHLNETMKGLITIRGLGAQNVARDKFNRLQDRHTSSYYLFFTSFAAFGFYIEFVSFLFISVVTMSLILIGKDLGLTASQVGLAITQSIMLTFIVQYGALNCSQINSMLVSIRRVLKYNTIPQEEDSEDVEVPPVDWPSDGRVTFTEVNLRYPQSDRLVLKNLSFSIEPGNKVGIVGRTGAGKSSLLSALFRLTNVSGLIEIDGLDISRIPLHILRSKMAIIPQDPVLFSGSLRYNLDPFIEYDDVVLYEALKAVRLNTVKKLESQVRDRGSNYSVGERQLICLARAIIRRNKIVIIDEATANIDSHTDAIIQETMTKEFGDCTILTVAHRLSTVMNCDKILVMDSGELVELGHPFVLIEDASSKLRGMVNQAGPIVAEQLRAMALKNYQKTQT